MEKGFRRITQYMAKNKSSITKNLFEIITSQKYIILMRKKRRKTDWKKKRKIQWLVKVDELDDFPASEIN